MGKVDIERELLPLVCLALKVIFLVTGKLCFERRGNDMSNQALRLARAGVQSEACDMRSWVPRAANVWIQQKLL